MDTLTFRDILLKRKLVSQQMLDRLDEAKADGDSRPLTEMLESWGYMTGEQLSGTLNEYFLGRKIGSILLDSGAVTETDVKSALLEKKKLSGARRFLGDILVEAGVIDEDRLAVALAHQFDLPIFTDYDREIDPLLLNTFPVDEMREGLFIPFSAGDGRVDVVIADPTDVFTLDLVRSNFSEKVEFFLGTPSGIRGLLESSATSDAVLDAGQQGDRFEFIREEDEADEVELEEDVDLLEDEKNPVVRLVNSLMTDAIEKRASDVHIEGYEQEVKAKYRIDGVLFTALDNIDKKYQNLVISRIKIMASLDIAEKRQPQDGRFKLKFRGRNIDFRVSILPTIFGESAVVRILDKMAVTLDVDRLGMDPEDLKKFKACVREPYGMILVCGPTGSGKTTTLYSAMKFIHRSEDKIITIEDPVEYQLPDIIQIPVNVKKGLTFAKGLRSIVRQDPDKIMIGEIRDEETGQIAVNAALTGHLVFSTVHSNNVFDAVSRLMNMGIDLYQFVSSFKMVMAQRLVRKLCDFCKAPGKPDREFFEEYGFDWDRFGGRTFYSPVGCRKCSNIGYSGRTGIFELLVVSDQMKDILSRKVSPLIIRKVAVQEGLVSLRQAAFQKALLGSTSLTELNRVTTHDMSDGELAGLAMGEPGD